MERRINYASKLTREQVRILRKEYERGGVTQGALSQKYKVSVSQIGRILRGEMWQEPGNDK